MMQIELPVHGKSYDAKKDKKRIDSLRRKIWDLMADGKWRSLRTIWQNINQIPIIPVGCDITRRLREMRDIGYYLDKRTTEINGVWEYRAVKVKK